MNNHKIKFRFWNDVDKIFHFPSDVQAMGAFFVLVGTKQKFIAQQFTGINDIEGKEIYDGDICKINLGGETYVTKAIEFFNGMFIFGNKNHNCLSEYTDKFFELKVIGNIFENPELLK